MIATADEFAPGSRIGCRPRWDLERTFGLMDGDLCHGALSLNRLFGARPRAGQADCRGALLAVPAPTPAVA